MSCTIAVPMDLLASVLAMASQQIEDVETGLETRLYDAQDNQDLPQNKQALEKLQGLLEAAKGNECWMMHCPVLTTAHLEQETGKRLLSNGFSWLLVAEYETGFFLRTERDPDHFNELPEDLRNLMAWARDHGHDWLRFDADGDEVEGLPSYDW